MHAAPTGNRDQNSTPRRMTGSAQEDELSLKGQGLLQVFLWAIIVLGVSLWKGGRGRVMDDGTYFS